MGSAHEVALCPNDGVGRDGIPALENPAIRGPVAPIKAPTGTHENRLSSLFS